MPDEDENDEDEKSDKPVYVTQEYLADLTELKQELPLESLASSQGDDEENPFEEAEEKYPQTEHCFRGFGLSKRIHHASKETTKVKARGRCVKSNGEKGQGRPLASKSKGPSHHTKPAVADWAGEEVVRSLVNAPYHSPSAGRP